YQTTPPTGMTVDDVGDLWFDTDDKNHLYRWSGTQWTSMRDGSAVRTLPPLGWVEVTQTQTDNVTVRYAGALGENGVGPLEWQRVIVNNDSGTFSWPGTWETATLPQTEQVFRLPKFTRVIHFRVRDAGGYISAPFSLP